MPDTFNISDVNQTGDGNAVVNTGTQTVNKTGEKEPTWADVEALVGDDLQADVAELRELAEGDEDIAPPDGLIERIYAAAPEALDIAGTLIAKGPHGAAGAIVQKIGVYIKTQREKEK